MATEVRYMPMIDEGDNGYPKMMRVIYDAQGNAIAQSEAPLSEAKAADPSSIASYYDCLREYFTSVASYIDLQTDITPAMSRKMFEVFAFCSSYISQNPLDFSAGDN
jgi:hypothetical protein